MFLLPYRLCYGARPAYYAGIRIVLAAKQEEKEEEE
jgi:hypothetical protein